MQPHAHQEPVTDLVLGIARDAEHLAGRYAELTMLDLRREVTRAKRAMIAIAASAALVGVAGLLLALAACHALTAVTGLPLPASYALGGGALGIAGLMLLWRDRRRELDVTPPALDEAREDLQWIKEHS